MQINDETTSNSIAVEWYVAHNGETKDDLIFRWRSVRDRLSGALSLALRLKADDEVVDDMRTLIRIAEAHYLAAFRNPGYHDVHRSAPC